MKAGSKIELRPKDNPEAEPMIATVLVANEEGAYFLEVKGAPQWFLQSLQRRGIFAENKGDWNLSIFKDWTGGYTDTFLNHYTLRELPQ